VRVALRVAALACLLGGCTKSLTKTYGTRAYYRSDVLGYVVSLDPDEDEQHKRWTLSHPLNGLKFRCREDLLAWRPVLERAAPQVEQQDAAMTNAMAATLPLTVAGALLMAPGRFLSGVFTPTSTSRLRKSAGRMPPDEEFVRLGTAKYRGDHLALVRLGELLEKRGRKDDAILAYRIFVLGYGAPSEQYRFVADRLEALGADPLPACQSTEPVDFVWQE
jgi:hypothetical protein